MYTVLLIISTVACGLEASDGCMRYVVALLPSLHIYFSVRWLVYAQPHQQCSVVILMLQSTAGLECDVKQICDTCGRCCAILASTSQQCLMAGQVLPRLSSLFDPTAAAQTPTEHPCLPRTLFYVQRT